MDKTEELPPAGPKNEKERARYVNRDEIISKIKEAGVSPAAALEALLAQSQALINMRLSDMDDIGTPSEDSKEKVSALLTEFGFDPENRDPLVKSGNAILDLVEARSEEHE